LIYIELMTRIGMYDSGCGGISVLNHLLRCGFTGEIYYFADTINNPWGTKSKHQLKKILISISEWFNEMDIDTIYSGCNTTLSLFKHQLPTLFKPHVHTIFENTKQHYVDNFYSVICTENSCRHGLFSTFFPHKTIEEIPCHNLARLIETNQLDLAVTSMCNYINQSTHDTVILGCTHYPLILPKVAPLFPKKTFIDPAQFLPITKSNSKKTTIHFKVTGNTSLFSSLINKFLITNTNVTINGNLLNQNKNKIESLALN
jgi:glutamate racemase